MLLENLLRYEDGKTVTSLTTGSGDIVFNQDGGGNITFTLATTDDGDVTLDNNGGVNIDADVTAGEITATGTISIETGDTIYDDGVTTTDITAPVASLVAINGTIGILDTPVNVNVDGTLYVDAGGTEALTGGWLSVNLQGQDPRALLPSMDIPGIILMNEEDAGNPFANGSVYYFYNTITRRYFSAISQNDAEVANVRPPYALTLETYRGNLFAPMADLVGIMGRGVTKEKDEDK